MCLFFNCKLLLRAALQLCKETFCSLYEIHASTMKKRRQLNIIQKGVLRCESLETNKNYIWRTTFHTEPEKPLEI